MQTLNDAVADELRELAERLDREGKLLSHARLDACYATFRARFGPDVLGDLDGEALLTTLHGGIAADGLNYWLEFKNDEGFPNRFGSIAGGSAFKFGLFFHQGKEVWVTGSPQKVVEVTLPQAIEIARTHRNELCLGAKVLSEFVASTDDADYRHLQTELAAVAPTLQDLAWGHKYFSLLYPEKLDDFHNPDYQRFHLVRLLQVPPPGVSEWPTQGRYLAAGRFVELAKALGRPMNQVTYTLNERDGHSPYAYYRIGTTEGTSGPSLWDEMRSRGCVAIGWGGLGDLTALSAIPETGPRKAALKALLNETHPRPATEGGDGVNGNFAGQISAFIHDIPIGSLVVAMSGATALGIGRVTGGYRFQGNARFPHQRPVEWLSDERWAMSKHEGLRSTVRQVYKFGENQAEIERRIYGREPLLPPPLPIVGPKSSVIAPPLTGIPARIQGVLDRKAQLILFGPPGTGKTFWAETAARELAARSWFGRAFGQLSAEEAGIITERAVRLCSFHPAYGYEDFLEGYRPELVAGAMTFQRRDGVFLRLCADAEAAPDRAFYLIIDEINRGDIPRIFGELLTVLEKNKRGRPILLPLSGRAFQVPPNVFVLGTMNTADRSIALLDAALRRRFGFIELLPDSATLGDTALNGVPLRLWLDALNQSIVAHIGRDGRNLQIGHAYLLAGDGRPVADFATFARILEEDVVPLLQEYCYEDYGVLEAILGQGLVDSARQRVRQEMFARDRVDDLVTALLAPFPNIATALPTPTTSAEASEAGDAAMDEETDAATEEAVGGGEADLAADALGEADGETAAAAQP